MKILHLTIMKPWFDMLNSGIKTEDYRDLTDYWRVRLTGKIVDPHFTHVGFRNGYSRHSPYILFDFRRVEIGYGNPDWGAEPGKQYYIVKLGRKVSNFHMYNSKKHGWKT